MIPKKDKSLTRLQALETLVVTQIKTFFWIIPKINATLT